MSISIVHLSDLHFRKNWEEDQGVVLDAFFKDLAKQIQHLNKEDIYLVFSGDIVLAGSNKELYDSFLVQFEKECGELGITKKQRICIPGNHDVSQTYIEQCKIEHAGVLAVSIRLNEKDFNDYIGTSPKILLAKFANDQ